MDGLRLSLGAAQGPEQEAAQWHAGSGLSLDGALALARQIVVQAC